ncbi:hypothetical protein C8F01DRAFT_1115842 [Mycena amicta]|nr:hypothetical protein C8F01DRAFT_1115842 [Mycena amicta]
MLWSYSRQRIKKMTLLGLPWLDVVCMMRVCLGICSPFGAGPRRTEHPEGCLSGSRECITRYQRWTLLDPGRRLLARYDDSWLSSDSWGSPGPRILRKAEDGNNGQMILKGMDDSGRWYGMMYL